LITNNEAFSVAWKKFLSLELRIHITPVLTPTGLQFLIEPNGKAGPQVPPALLIQEIEALVQGYADAAAVFQSETIDPQKDVGF
jgi:hypothetical protein